MLLGLLPLKQQWAREMLPTYKVDHDEVVLGMAAAAPAGAIRVQAALERRCSLWGIWRIHHGIRILQLQVLGSKHGKGYIQTGQGHLADGLVDKSPHFPDKDGPQDIVGGRPVRRCCLIQFQRPH